MLELNSKDICDVRSGGDWEMKFELPEIKIGQKIYLKPEIDDLRLAQGNDKYGYFYASKYSRPKETIVKSQKARKILKLIAENMYKNAEPGIQNIDIARKYSNSDVVGFPIIGTNACSEIYIDDQGNCNLSSIFAEMFYDKENGVNLQLLEENAISINRFLDNTIQKEIDDMRYATYEQKISLENLRRTGAGFTNIVELLLLNNLEYGTKEGNVFIQNFVDKYNYFLYKASINLGKEKGSFLAFDKDKYLKSNFIKHMIKNHNDLDFNYMRNICVSSVAPVGCTIKETEIITTDGIKSIQQIFEENNINISKLEETSEKKWFNLLKPMYAVNINNSIQKITKLYYNGYDIVKIIEFENGAKFTGTHETHKLLVKSKEKKGYGIWKTLNTLT